MEKANISVFLKKMKVLKKRYVEILKIKQHKNMIKNFQTIFSIPQ